jgi:hypothetical protein
MNDYTINPLDTVTWLPSHNSRRDTTACGRLLVHVVPSGVAEKARATQAIALIRSASWARARRTPRWCSTVMSRSRGANAVRRRSFRLSIALRSAQRASSAYPTIACFFVDKGYRRRGGRSSGAAWSPGPDLTGRRWCGGGIPQDMQGKKTSASVLYDGSRNRSSRPGSSTNDRRARTIA